MRDSKPFLTHQFGIESLGLFGSYATEQATTESDIDLFYIPQEGISVGYTQRVLLEEYLTQLLQNPKIDLINYRYMNPIVKSDIEKRVIYI